MKNCGPIPSTDWGSDDVYILYRLDDEKDVQILKNGKMLPQSLNFEESVFPQYICCGSDMNKYQVCEASTFIRHAERILNIWKRKLTYLEEDYDEYRDD